MKEVRFLTVPEVTALHDAALEVYGGEPGVLGQGELLEAALGAARAGTAEGYLLRDLFEMAAAVLCHIILDHPFLDGNKRTGSAAAMTFLKLNGVEPTLAPDELRDMALAVQAKRLERAEVAAILRRRRRRGRGHKARPGG